LSLIVTDLFSTGPTSRAFATFTRWVRRYAWLVVIVSLGLSAAGAAFVAGNFAVDTDTANMLSANLPFRRAQTALDKAFPQDDNTLVILIEGRDADRVDAAGNALSARLKADPARFGRVFDPAGDPFFRRNGLLFLDMATLTAVTDELARAQPFIGAVAADPSLRGLFGVLTLAADQIATDPSAAAGSASLAPILDAIADQVTADTRGVGGRLDWSKLMGGEENAALSKLAGRRIIVLQPPLDFRSLRPGAKAIADVRAAARDVGIGGDSGVRVQLTGPVALSEEELENAQLGSATPELISFALVGALSLLCFRSARLSVAALFTVLAGLIWTATFASAAVGPLNLVSVAFFVLFIGFAVDFGIHYGLRYTEGLSLGLDHGAALERAAAGVGIALVLCALCAALGFFSFLPTTYVGLQQLGFIAGFGMAIALVANLTLLPAMLTVLPGRTSVAAGKITYGKGRLRRWIEAHPRPIITVTAILSIAAVVTAPAVRFDFDPLNLKNPNSESVRALRDLLASGQQESYAIAVVAPSLAAANDIAARARALPQVSGAATIASLVPEHQDDKLALIDSTALMLGPSLAEPRLPPPSPEQTREAIARFETALGRLAGDGKGGGEEAPADDRKAAAHLLAALTAWHGAQQGDDALARLSGRIIAGLPDRLSSLEQSLSPQKVTIATLPADLRARWVTPDGRYKVEIYPQPGAAGDSAALARFVAAVQAIAPNAAGPPVMIVGAGREIVAAFAQAAAIAVAAIALVLALLLRRIRDVLFSFIPVTLAALYTMAASVLLDVPFNFANVIVLPLLFGLGVTASLNLVVRERQEGAADQMMSSCTPRAITFSALTMISAFGTLAISHHPGIASMGLLLAIAIALTLLCTVVVLPALMTLIRRTKPRD
jgi:hopanoid biosynthesis associated RND transporter like protein HpnN